MAKTIEGIQGSVTVDKGTHDQVATVAFVARQNNVAHAPVTVHLTTDAVKELLAELAGQSAAVDSANAATTKATPDAKKA